MARKVQEFWLNYSTGAQKANIRNYLLEHLAWFRSEGPASYSQWAWNDAYVRAAPLPVFAFPWMDQSNWKSGEYWIYDCQNAWSSANLSALTPDQVFDPTLLSQMYFTSGDTAMFPAFSGILGELVGSWLEEPARRTQIAFSQVDADHWRLLLTWAADAASRWPGAYSVDVTVEFLPSSTIPWASLNHSSMAFEAIFIDSEGAPATVEFRANTTPDALAIANAIAEKSESQWTELRRIRELVVPTQDVNSNPIFTSFQVAAAAGSDVQRKGRCVWASSVVGDCITLEIPSVAPAYLSDGTQKTTVEPVDAATRALIKSENDAPAHTFRQAKLGIKVRNQ